MKKKSTNTLRTLFYDLIHKIRSHKTFPQSNVPEKKILIEAFTLLKDKKYQEVLALIENKNESEFLALKGLVFTQIKEDTLAEENFKKAIEIDDTFVYSYYGLGNIYQKGKKYNEAEKTYNIAISKDKNFAAPYYGLGIVYKELKRYEEAERAYNTAISKDENFAYPYNSLGNLYSDQKRYDEAEKAYNTAISKDENYAAPYNGLGNLYSDLKRYEEAEKAYNTAINKDESIAYPYNGLGTLYKDLKKYDEAERAYKIAISKDENYAAPYNALGNLYKNLQRYDEAEKAYHASISKDENYAAPYNGLGNLYSDLKRYDEAEKAYNIAIRKDENYSYAYNGLGILYFDLKRYDEAEKAFKTAISKDGNYAAPYNSLGNLYFELKRFDEAEQFYNLSISKDPENTIPVGNLALLYNEINKKPEIDFLTNYKKLALKNGRSRDEYILEVISGNNAEAQKEVEGKRQIDEKLNETKLITTSGFVIFIDLCNSTEFKMKFKEEWFERLIHFYTATEKHLMDKLSDFIEQVHLLKYIGDEIMFFIEEKTNGDHCKDFKLLLEVADFIETIREYLNRSYFLDIKPSNVEESTIPKMISYEFADEKIDIKTCITYVNEVNKYTFNKGENFDILGSPVDLSARLMGLCKENMVICNHDFAQMFAGTNHQKKFKNIGTFEMKGIDDKYPGNTDVYIFDHNNLSSIIDKSYINKHSTINEQIIGRFLLSDRIKNQ